MNEVDSAQIATEWLDEHNIHTVRTVGVNLDGLPIGCNLLRSQFEATLPLGPSLPAEALLVDLDGETWLEAPRAWIGQGDPHQRPDVGSLTDIGDGVALCMVDHVGSDGTPLPICPRARLADLEDETNERGMSLTTAITLDAVFHAESASEARAMGHRNLTPVGSTGPLYRHDHEQGEFSSAIAEYLDRHGVAWSGWHGGSDRGQIRLVLAAVAPTRAADQVIAARQALRSAAASVSASVSFLAAGSDSRVGSAMEIEMYLGPAFPAADDGSIHPQVLSWIGGLLNTAPAASTMTNPTVNAYRRIGRFGGAPLHAIWGSQNRSALISTSPVGRPEDPSGTKITHLGCSSDANPHLALAAVIAGGLIGMDDNVQPTDSGDVIAWALPPDRSPLPTSLIAARDLLAADRVLRERLGPELADTWLAARRHEWERFHAESQRPETGIITDWELDRYAEIG